MRQESRVQEAGAEVQRLRQHLRQGFQQQKVKDSDGGKDEDSMVLQGLR
jgi:hypothetical protein